MYVYIYINVCVTHLNRCKASIFSWFSWINSPQFISAGGTGVTLVPVHKTARSHSDIEGRRPFDVPAVVRPFVARG